MVKHLHNHKGSPTKDVVTSIWALPVWAGWPKLCLPSTGGLAGLLKRAGSAPPSHEGRKENWNSSICFVVGLPNQSNLPNTQLDICH